MSKEQRKIIPPLLEWVVEYCNERQNDVVPQKFFDHYESVDWFRGKTKIRDWQAAVRTWEKNSVYNRPQSQTRRQKPEVAL